jgi:hypothetical protein
MTEDFTPPIFAAGRQEKIAALVTSRGRIHLDELASVCELSQPTLRKDLTILERQGVLKRTHGGALSTRVPAEREMARSKAGSGGVSLIDFTHLLPAQSPFFPERRRCKKIAAWADASPSTYSFYSFGAQDCPCGLKIDQRNCPKTS